MAKFLRDLLNAKEPLFSAGLKQLEATSGRHGVDAKLIGDILQLAHESMRELGLDHQDTTGPELYHALLVKIQQHDAHLAKTIGASSYSPVVELLPLIKQAIDDVDMPRDCWVIKKSVAKKMLRMMPPHNIMAHLGYRSIDSMLKHERLPEIYGALRYAESAQWLAEFNGLYDQLRPTDFEKRDIEIIIVSAERWSKYADAYVQQKCHNVAHLKELGMIYILPINQKCVPGLTVRVMSLVLHYLNEIRLYSSYFKLCQVRKDFGKIFVDILTNDDECKITAVGQQMHWRVVQRYFGGVRPGFYPKIFEPHVQLEDLQWRRVEEVMSEIDPVLKFWQNRDYVGLLFDDQPVSFNLMDAAAAYCGQLPYNRRQYQYFKDSLYNKIFIRYMSQKAVEGQVLQQIDNGMA